MAPTAKYATLPESDDKRPVGGDDLQAEPSALLAAFAEKTDCRPKHAAPAVPSKRKRHHLYLQVPTAQSMFEKLRSRLVRAGKAARKTPIEEMQEAKQHKEAIKTLLDEFMKQQEALNPRLGRKGGSAKASALPEAAMANPEAITAEKRKQERQVERFLILFSRSLQLYGCPTHVSEYHGEQVAKALSFLKVHFAVLPTFTLVVFNRDDDEGLGGNTIMFRSSTGFDMYRLQLVDEIARRVASYTSFEPPAGNARDAFQEIKATIKPELNPAVMKVQEAPANSAAAVAGSTMLLRHVIEPEEAHEEALRSDAILKSEPACKEGAFAPAVSAMQALSRLDQQQERVSNLKEMILALSSFGPGFLLDNTRWRKRKGLSAEDSQQALYEQIFAQLALEDASERLQLVVSMPPLYPASMYPLFYAIASGGGSLLFFRGGWWDLPVTFVIGFGIGMMRHFTKETNFMRIYEFCSSVIIGFFARTLLYLGTPICFSATCLSCVIFLIQGLSITMSMTEVLTRNMVMGMSRLGFALLITAIIGYGLDLGAVLAEYIFVMPKVAIRAECPAPVDAVWLAVVFTPTMVVFNLRFNSHRSQLPAMLVMQAIAYTISRLLATVMGFNLAAGFAALAAGVASNVYARLSGNPPIVYIIAALLVLVPGAMAVMGFSSVLSISAIETMGVSLATTVLLSSISISIALFTANIVSPQTELNALARAKRGKFDTLGF